MKNFSTQERKNIVVLAATAFLRGAHNSVFNVIWQPFVLSLGVSMSMLGALSSLAGMNGIVTTIAQPLGGWSADRLGRKPFILAASFVIALAYVLFVVAGLTQWWWVLVLGFVLYASSALTNPARASMVAESVRAGRHGTAFSLMLVAGIVPGIVAPTLGGWLADRFGYVSVFPIGVALEVIVLLIVWRFLRETRSADGTTIRWRDAMRALIQSMTPPKALRGFFLACAGDSFAWGMGWGLLYGMLSKTYNFSTEQLGVMASISSLAWAIAQMPIGRYIDSRGTRGMLIFSEAIGIPLMLIAITQTRFEIFAAAQILFGLTAATWVPTTQTFLSRSVSAETRAETFGRLNMFRGLIAFPASWIGGMLYDAGSLPLPMFANLIGILVVIAILILFVREPKTEVSSQ